MRKAFSLVEILTTCALIAIVLGLITASYVGLSQRTRSATQNKDQGAFQQVIEAFHMTGGNIAAILDPSQNNGASPEVQAAALTQVLKQSANSDARKRLGTVSSMLSADLVVVPYGNDATTLNDGKLRMVYSGGVLSLQTSGSGFAITSSTANSQILSRQGSPDQSAVSTLATAAAPVIASGSKFAAANQYVYDEDPVPVGAPVATPATTNTSPMIGLGAIISVVNSGGAFVTTPLTYAQYTDSSNPYKAQVFLYRIDGQPIPSSAGISVSASLGSDSARPLTPAGSLIQNIVVGNQTLPVQGLVFNAKLSDVSPAGNWTDSTEILISSVAIDQSNPSSKSYSIPSESNTTVTASPVDLSVAFVGSPANPFTLASGSSFSASGTTLASGGTTPAGVAVVSLSFDDGKGNTSQPSKIAVVPDGNNPDLLLKILPTS